MRTMIITLGLAATGLLSAPIEIIEPLIAVSITVLAIEAILFQRGTAWRLPVVFAFGLLHGFNRGATVTSSLEAFGKGATVATRSPRSTASPPGTRPRDRAP